MSESSFNTIAKGSLVYSMMLSHPFATYAHSFPMMQNDILLETEQLTFQEHGESVEILQQKLNKLSYYEHAIDGQYGVFTEHAIKQFQRDNFLYVTGQADLATIQAIIIRDIENHMEQLQSFSHKIYLGMHSEDVKIVQTSLQFFGYYEGEIDGIYGPLTEKALQTVEREHEVKLIENHPEPVLTSLYENELNKVKNVAQTKETQEVTEQLQSIPQEEANIKEVVDVAQSLIGSPYVWGGTDPSGFDCSGFVQYVFETQNKTVPRTVSDMWNFSKPVSNPSVGDLVFFETYKAGPSHMGIYVGNGQFIHAGTSTGVTTSELNTSYWKERYIGAKRVQF